MNWFLYSLPPIDHGWQHLKTVKETLALIAKSDDEMHGAGDFDSDEITSFMRRWESAKEAAKDHGWEGDFRGQPRVFWIPSENEFDVGFVFKQDNNGTTFVVSPQELPSVEKLT